MNQVQAGMLRHVRRASGWQGALLLSGALLLGCGKTDDRPYVWAYISPVILQPNCASASCHSNAAAVAGLDFSTPERGYQSLTKLHVWVASSTPATDGSCEKAGDGWLCPSPRSFLVPYAPGESRLVSMLRARNAPRMPPDRPLTEPDIALIETWILNGASETAGVAPAWEAGVLPSADGASREAGSDLAAMRDGDNAGDASMDSSALDMPGGMVADGGLADGVGSSDRPSEGSGGLIDAGAGQ